MIKSVKIGKKPDLSGSTQSQNNLREVRLKEGMTAAAIGRLAGVNERTVRDVESGKRPAREVTLHRILNGINGNPNRIRKQEYTFDEIFQTNHEHAKSH